MMKNSKNTYLPAIRGKVGKWIFYTTIMTFEEIKNHVSLVVDIYQSKGLSDMMQRVVRSNRAEAIAKYLMEEEERFFPSMIVAVYDGKPRWIEMSIDDETDEDLKLDFSNISKSKLETIGFLTLTGEEKLFPLDGQHRLAGIGLALKNRKSGSLGLPKDEMAVTFVAHEKSETGQIRSRRLFTTLNKRAVPVGRQEIIALDEDEVMAVATRHLVEKFEPLSKDGIVLFSSQAGIPRGNVRAFTSVVAIYDALCLLFQALTAIKLYDLRNKRISSGEMDIFCSYAEAYYTSLMKVFAEVRKCLVSDRSDKVIAANRHDSGGHILFRPVGQKIVSSLVSIELKRKFPRGLHTLEDPLDYVSDMVHLEILNAVRKFSGIPTELSEIPYKDIVFSSKSNRIKAASALIVRDIILVHYGIYDEKLYKKLDERIRKVTEEEFGLKDYRWKI